jgi:predicted transcriptional regulator of viral defense system
MKYLEFRERLLPLGFFSIPNIKIFFPDFDNRRLVEWQDKGYLIKIINKWYVFAEIEQSMEGLYRIANKIYQPSYVSLESAFSYYNLIPEGVFTITSVSTKKTSTFDTPIGNFGYRSIQSSLFFGYQIKQVGNMHFAMADLEKCILDYLYLHPNLVRIEDFEALRLNPTSLSQIKWELMKDYLKIYDNKSLEKRAEGLINYVDHVGN